MSKQEELALVPAGNLALSDIFPILERLEHQLGYVCTRVEEFVPRRTIPDSVKQRHLTVIKLLGGRCPCCGIVTVLDDYGVVNGEFDHFYSRERNALEDTWLICKACHRDMKDRVRFTDQFRVYQQRVVAAEGGQLTLI